MNKRVCAVLVLAALAAGGYESRAADTGMENAGKRNSIVSDTVKAQMRQGNEYKAAYSPETTGRVSFSHTEKKENLNTGFPRKDKRKEQPISPENPLRLEADKIKYNHETGDIALSGYIRIEHMMDRYTADYVYGNTLTQKYVVPGAIQWVNPTLKMEAESAEYDGSSATGKFQKVSGWESDLYYFRGTDGIYDRDANKIVVRNGYFTTKHAVAKVPDYRIEADLIDMYPGDRYVAHNVKLKFKNTTVITLSKYSGSLSSDRGPGVWSLMPRPMYDNDNGWGLQNRIDIPLTRNHDLSFYMRNTWYSKVGYKPDIGVKYEIPAGQIALYYAEKESATNDEGGIWIKKKPAFVFDSQKYYFGKSPIYASFRGEISYWDESWGDKKVKGPYKGFDVYISGPAVPLGKFLTFNWRIGHAKDYYDYKEYKAKNLVTAKDGIRKSSYYSIGLQGKYRSFSGWVDYTERNLKGVSPYLYDTYSMENPLDTGFRIELTPKDAVSVSWSIDTVNGNLRHRYYTYYRDMHSFYGWIRYDRVMGDVRVMISPKDFKF